MADLKLERRFKKEKRERCASNSEDDQRKKLLRDESKSSITMLEELVKCSIHLDKLNDPRMLPCAHVFCLQCLSDTVVNLPPNVPLKCPMCARILPITSSTPDKVAELPKACFHNELDEYLTVHNHNKRLSLDSPTNEDKIRLHQLLLEHPNCTFSSAMKPMPYNSMRKLSDIQGYCQSNETPNLEEMDHKADSEDISMTEESQVLHSCIDLDDNSRQTDSAFCSSCSHNDSYSNIKSNMRKYSRYRLLMHYGLSKRAPTGHHSATQEPSSTLVCIVNSNNGTVEIRKPEDVHIVINPTIEKGCPLRPIFAQLVDNHVYVSGVTLMNCGYMVKLNLDSSIVACSKSYDIHPNLKEEYPLGGFCFDCNNKKIYFAIPAEKRISVLSMTDLSESPITHILGDYRPIFLALRSSSKEVWISCPKEKRLLILDIESGNYLSLPIDRANKACPLHLISTWDCGRTYERVIFLDKESSRVYWMVKQNNHVDIHAIIFTSRALRRLKIHQLLSFDSDNRLVIVTDENEVYVTVPEKNIDISCPSKRDDANCILL